jgi:hypothetical protein
MSNIIDLGTWKAHEFCLVAEIIQAVKENKLSSELDKVFDWNSMKIGFNENSGYVYMFDDDGNQAMVFDDVLYLVDNDGDIIKDDKNKEKKVKKKKVIINI